MALGTNEAVSVVRRLLAVQLGERSRLERLLSYRRTGAPPTGLFASSFRNLPRGVPPEVRDLVQTSRVNLIRFVVTSRVQDMVVDGFQSRGSDDNLVWDVWQGNALDARQMGVHRAALTFGSSYVVVTPGDPVPVVRGASPRDLTALYGDDDVWPEYALLRVGKDRWRLYDDTSVYAVSKDGNRIEVALEGDHEMGVCPVVRFRDSSDLDVDVEGVVEPLTDLQDQINITSFGLHVAQHYGAFRQRYILGWLADSESDALRVGASRMMTFEDAPGDIQVGEFSQTELRGYIESREASIRHLATVSQTPVHELMGEMINLSAEALEAARASHHAAVSENQVVVGESWEQVLRLAARESGATVDDDAAVIWRDTTMRSFKEAVDGLGSLASSLGVPKRALWSRVPGVTQTELARWEAEAEKAGGLSDIMSVLTQGEPGAGSGQDA